MTADDPSPAAAFRESTPGSEIESACVGFDTFLENDPAGVEDVADADAAVFGAPYDGTVSNRSGRGSEREPSAVLTAGSPTSPATRAV